MQLQEIQEIIGNMQNDSTMMLVGGVAIAILLAIVLVIVVSTMRVISYKNRFKNLLIENKEKATYITELENELQVYKIKDKKNKQDLAQFDDTKKKLKDANDMYRSLQNKFAQNEKELEQSKKMLKAKEEQYDALVQEYESATERYSEALEENTKYRTTNARLLMKLENEERFMKTMKEKKDSQGTR